MNAALGMLAEAYAHRDNGITYGGDFGTVALSGQLRGSVDSWRGKAIGVLDGEERLRSGAPDGVDGAADATWNASNDGAQDVYALALTFNGARTRLGVWIH